jgi:hypothetical protein
MEKPILVERFADNGAYSHWELITEDGLSLWTEGGPAAIKTFPGTPPHPYSSEWFLARLKGGGGWVVLKALPKEFTYDFKTVDESHFSADRIVAWAQLPDSEYVPHQAGTLKASPKVTLGKEGTLGRRVSFPRGKETLEGTLVSFGMGYEEVRDGVAHFSTALVMLDSGEIWDTPTGCIKVLP